MLWKFEKRVTTIIWLGGRNFAQKPNQNVIIYWHNIQVVTALQWFLYLEISMLKGVFHSSPMCHRICKLMLSWQKYEKKILGIPFPSLFVCLVGLEGGGRVSQVIISVMVPYNVLFITSAPALSQLRHDFGSERGLLRLSLTLSESVGLCHSTDTCPLPYNTSASAGF